MSRSYPGHCSSQIGALRLEFEALGKNWHLIDEEGLADASCCVGTMEVDGQRYAILPFEGPVATSSRDPASHFAQEVVEVLTPRELQVCELIAAGRCDKQIARSLGISTYTEREHVRRIFAKLKISRRSAVLPTILGLAQSDDGPNPNGAPFVDRALPETA